MELSPLRFSSALTALSALKVAEDGNSLILRLYEPFGARGDLAITPPPGWRLEGPLNLMEEPMAREAQHDFTPFEVRTWRLVKTTGA
jgi:alpha-mannosidase